MKHVLKTFQTAGEIPRNISKQKEIKMKTNYQPALAVNGIKRILVGFALAAGAILTQPAMAAYPAPVDLQSCSNFTVLGSTDITRIGLGIINGDVGLSPGVGSKITGFLAAQVNGTIYAVDTSGPAGSSNAPVLLATAQGDLTTAYNDAAGRSTDRITVSGNIGGLTFAPGLYWSATSLKIVGDLTLDAGGDANAVWIFQMGSTLTTEAGGSGDPHSRVILKGGAKAANVFWQVGSSATLGTYSIFKGTIMAYMTITMNVGSIMEGRALAQNGAVTFGGSSGSLPSDLPGWLEIQVEPSSGNWRLTVPDGYTGRTTGTGDLAAVSAVAGEYGIAYGALSNYMAPTNNNQVQVVVAGVTSLFVGVYREVSTDIAPPFLTASEGTYPDKVRISWPSVPGVIGYEIWKSLTNDVNTALLIADVPDDGTGTFQYDDEGVVPNRSYYYWGLSKKATKVSPMSLVCLGYARLSDPNAGTADITASDMVYLPVNVTNLTTAGTVSFRLGNLGPDTLNSDEVAFDFRMGGNNTNMVLLGSAQRAFTNLAKGQEQLVILTAPEKLNLVVSATLSGVKQVQVTVRHVSTLNDPNLANNKTTAAGMVLVRAAGINSPGRSVNDYDGDGKSDGCLYQSTLGRWYEALSGTRYGIVSIGDVGIGWAPVPGDYDGDGITDVAAYERSSGWWQALRSSNGQIISGQLGGPAYTPVQRDFDGDTITDPSVYREANGSWVVAASSRQYALGDASLGGTGYQPVMADYDGDGLADPAVYNRTTGLWAIGFSSIRYQVMTGTFGGPGYLPVSADYDGDGLVDPAIYAPGTAHWQVLFSRSLATQGGYTWCDGVLGGINGIPVQADYDGDGLADPTVYHQDTSLWELFLSTQGYQLVWGLYGGPEYTPVTE